MTKKTMTGQDELKADEQDKHRMNSTIRTHYIVMIYSHQCDIDGWPINYVNDLVRTQIKTLFSLFNFPE